MNWIRKFENKISKYTFSNITYFLIAGQAVVFALNLYRPELSNNFFLQGNLVLQGQWWRLFTFLFAPISNSLIFVLFTWYFYYLMGTELENRWGEFRYQLYLLISWIGLVLVSFLFPGQTITNLPIFTSIFLACTHLYPEFRVLLFFIIPVKLKWLGWLTWAIIIFTFLISNFSGKIVIIFGVINYLIFFYQDILSSFNPNHQELTQTIKKITSTPRYVCPVCGMNELTNPDMQIRYCDQCKPGLNYCEEHALNHNHIIKEP